MSKKLYCYVPDSNNAELCNQNSFLLLKKVDINTTVSSVTQ